MNKNIIITGVLIACVILINLSHSQTLTILDGGRINNNGYYGVEVGDGVYEGGSAGSGHGHAGLWYGLHGGNDAPILDPQDNGTNSNPRVYIRVGCIEQEGSGSGGIKFDYASGTVYWSYSGYTNGNLLDVIKNKYYLGIAKPGLVTFPASSSRYKGNAIGYNIATLNGYTRYQIRMSAKQIWRFKNDISYVYYDMIQADGPSWDRTYDDINQLRCDGVVEVSQEDRGLDVSCDDNIWFATGFDNHNNLHLGNFGYDILGNPEMCPKIQGRLSEESDHQGNNIPWDDPEVTHTTRNISGVPYIAGISIEYYSSLQKYNFYMDIDDYGSDEVYITIAGKYHTGEILLLLEGPTHYSPYNDPSKELFFRRHHLNWTYTPTNQDPPNLPHNYAVHSFDWYGYCLKYNHTFVKYDMNYFSAFQVAILDNAGNWILYEVSNPNYC